MWLCSGCDACLSKLHLCVFRLHKAAVDDACRGLEEYKQTLRMRYAAVTVTAAQTPPASVNEEIVCSFPTLPHRTHSTATAHSLHTDTRSSETAVVNNRRSHNNIVLADHTLLIHPALPVPSPALTTPTGTHVMAQPVSEPISISHSVHEDGLASIPQPAAGPLLDKRPSDGASSLREVPLLPPAVFLEYLRRKRSQALPTQLTPISPQVLKDPGVVPQEEHENTDPYWGLEMEKNRQVRDRIRKQRDALHTFLRIQQVLYKGEKKLHYGIYCVKGC